MVAIPQFVVEYFLLGKTRADAMERFTQDGGVGSDVWNAFARDPESPVRVLMAPTPGATSMMIASVLHREVRAFRRRQDIDKNVRPRRERADIAPLENFVGSTLYLDELLRVVLPLTHWWHRTGMGALSRDAALANASVAQALYEAITYRLGATNSTSVEPELRRRIRDEDENAAPGIPRRRILQAAPVAALIGVFAAAREDAKFLEELNSLDPKFPGGTGTFVEWVRRNAQKIAKAAQDELAQFRLRPPRDILWQFAWPTTDSPRTKGSPPLSLDLIQRVFLNRTAVLAETDALATIKADAASRLFEVSCNTITWAIIDSGIDRSHPAFEDHARRKSPNDVRRSRVRATYDFTRIDRIKSFDLAIAPAQSEEGEVAIREVIAELGRVPGRNGVDPEFEEMARKNLALIAGQLRRAVNPDWNLIEPLIRIDSDDASGLVSDHGTHVGGTLGADWRENDQGTPRTVLRGVCPDINLYDLRVIHEGNRESTEFALLAALEFVRFLNDRAGTNGPVVAGVNISLSIPYDVKTYGCGATPVCVACDRLADSGVVVVAAAGNRGWNEEELNFGNFVFSSITDPGNAQRVITVGSTHRLKPHVHGVSYFSSRGPTGDGRIKPDLVAPGEKIRGPVRGESDDELDGTSMAAPFVSGAAAMLMARHRELIGNAARIKQILCASATDLGRDRYFQGHGLVDVLRAMQSI